MCRTLAGVVAVWLLHGSNQNPNNCQSFKTGKQFCQLRGVFCFPMMFLLLLLVCAFSAPCSVLVDDANGNDASVNAWLGIPCNGVGPRAQSMTCDDVGGLGCRITGLGGNAIFTIEQTNLTRISLPLCSSIVGRLDVNRNSELVSIDIPLVTTIGSLSVSTNANLTHISFPLLSTVTNSFGFTVGIGSLANGTSAFYNFPSLVTVEAFASFTVTAQSGIMNLQSLRSVKCGISSSFGNFFEFQTVLPANQSQISMCFDLVNWCSSVPIRRTSIAENCTVPATTTTVARTDSTLPLGITTSRPPTSAPSSCAATQRIGIATLLIMTAALFL